MVTVCTHVTVDLDVSFKTKLETWRGLIQPSPSQQISKMVSTSSKLLSWLATR